VPFGMEYRVGFTNFNAITSYNRSHMYASAVHDLAEALATQREQAPPRAAVANPESLDARTAATPLSSAAPSPSD
jgi:Transglycosylase SLT domain